MSEGSRTPHSPSVIVAGKLVGVAALFAKRDLSSDGIDALQAIANVTANSIERHRPVRERFAADHRCRMMIEQVTDYAVFMTDGDACATTWRRNADSVSLIARF